MVIGKHKKYAAGLSLLAGVVMFRGLMFDSSLEYAALYTYALTGILLITALVMAVKALKRSG